jgi:hypothetical protein
MEDNANIPYDASQFGESFGGDSRRFEVLWIVGSARRKAAFQVTKPCRVAVKSDRGVRVYVQRNRIRGGCRRQPGCL